MSTDLAALPASKHARRSLTNIPRNVSTAALRAASVHTAWSEMSVRMEKFAVHYLRDYFEIKFRCHQVKKIRVVFKAKRIISTTIYRFYHFETIKITKSAFVHCRRILCGGKGVSM